ncbi:hypothetical protein [Pyruvatibacter mobilis]|uniref:hypothetical protein n=1 Tax=Pyruvatibacter mobilis TaxID=1712261 RepID=UPI003BAA42CB
MRRYLSMLPVSVAALALAGCVSWGWFEPEDFFAHYDLPQQPQLADATFCHAYSCQTRSQVDLTQVWPAVRAEFATVQTPAQERYAMAQAVGLVETAVGPVLGTADDPGGVLNSAWSGNPAYQDCIDEAANTTMLLVLMKQDGLFRFHDVDSPSIRGAFIDGRWQHYTAVVEETASEERYVVDSWFRVNGRPAVVMPFQDWYTGYGIPPEAA